MLTRIPIGSAFPALFDDTGRLFKEVDSIVRRTNGHARSFAVDLREFQDHYEILADLPGLAREEIDLTRDGAELAIEVRRASARVSEGHEGMEHERTEQEEREAVNSEDAGKVLHRERATLSGKRLVRLPEDADEVREAKLEAGVLSVVISKKPELQPKKIEIR